MNVDPIRLRHWSRVAFAVRCARRVQPLFAESWPDASENRKDAIEQAIALASLAAEREEKVEGLDEVVRAACGTAGRALLPHLYDVPMEDSEPAPLDRTAAVVASLAAKVAEKAGETAATEPTKSAKPAREAFYFALDALREAGQSGLVEVLEAEFAALLESEQKKPWWRFW